MLPEKMKMPNESKMLGEEAFRTSTGKRRSHPPLLRLLLLCLPRFLLSSTAIEILSKSKLERCVKTSGSDNLSCEKKIVINMVVPSSSSGGEASIVAELVEVEENDTQKMQTIRVPPIITINKSAAYALYELSYLRDAAYKPEEFYVKTRKCQPDASSKVVKICERLRDLDGHIIENTQYKISSFFVPVLIIAILLSLWTKTSCPFLLWEHLRQIAEREGEYCTLPSISR